MQWFRVQVSSFYWIALEATGPYKREIYKHERNTRGQHGNRSVTSAWNQTKQEQNVNNNIKNYVRWTLGSSCRYDSCHSINSVPIKVVKVGNNIFDWFILTDEYGLKCVRTIICRKACCYIWYDWSISNWCMFNLTSTKRYHPLMFSI